MYLRQARQTGLLGLIGYLVLATGFLLMLATEMVGLVVLPAIAATSPGYGDLGLLTQLGQVTGAAYLGGGLLFGIALFRSRILARWAAALLMVGAVAPVAILLLPQANFQALRHPHRSCPGRPGLLAVARSAQRRPVRWPGSAVTPGAGRREVTIHLSIRPTRSGLPTGWDGIRAFHIRLPRRRALA